MFNHQGPSVIRVIHDIVVGVFEHLEITSDMDVLKIIKYTQHILRGTAFNKYKTFLVGFKESASMKYKTVII